MLEAAVMAGDPDGAAEAVAMFTRVEEAARRTRDPQYWKSVINLANALMAQAETGDPGATSDRALDVLDRDDDLFRDADARSAYLASKGRALLMKAQHTGERAVMRDAVRVQKERTELAPKRTPERTLCMFDLGVTLLHSAAMFGDPCDHNEAVDVLAAVERRQSPVDRAAVLSALGNARLNRYLSTTRRDQRELARALAEHREAMGEAAPEDRASLVLLSDFGIALLRVYEQTTDRTALDASVEAQRRACEATPPGDARRAERLANLATALLTQHEVSSDPETLDEAISTSRDAVAAAAPGHAHRASCLYGLAGGLFRRGELRRTLLDFDEAAVRAGDAVAATPDGHANLPHRLALYAAALCYLPSVPKLERADQELTEAARKLRHDDPERALVESNHGALVNALVGYLDDASTARRYAADAVRLTRSAVGATPAEHSEYHGRLLVFAAASVALAQLDHDPAVLDEPLRLAQAASERNASGSPDPLLELSQASVLACRSELTEDDPGLVAPAIEAYQRGVTDTSHGAAWRLEAAHAGARFAAGCGKVVAALDLYVLAVSLLDSVVWRGIERRDQERLLAQYAQLPSDAAAVAITAGKPETAVELLERGRGVLLDRPLDDRADLARLAQVDAEAATRVGELQRAIDAVEMPDLEANHFELPDRPAHQRSEADERSELACRLDGVIAEIRSAAGCGDLFQPASFPALRTRIGTRNVVIVNVSVARCDALILTSAGVTITPLPSLTREDVQNAAQFFRDRAQQTARSDDRGHLARRELTDKLAWLWDVIGEPVMRDIGHAGAPQVPAEAPRVYWCATGPAVFLPLHAAGHHSEPAQSPPRAVIDRAASAYVPKLSALAGRRPDLPDSPETRGQPLIVSMPTTPGRRPLPSAETEAARLQGIFTDATRLTGPAATRDAVLAAMETHPWFHISAHGVTDDHTPADGGLELADGRLTIRDLAKLDLPDARFSYLSACATYQGSPAIPDETITIGTAMCAAGCQSVIAALWPVADDDAATFAEHVYRHLVSHEATGPVLHPERAPHALREAARGIRGEHPGEPERWAAFVAATSF
ncbi:MAG: CHAT domain-containing protein [Streptosporangiaceae bacterium]